nr:hypothetical protein [Chloroflexota bacterium]
GRPSEARRLADLALAAAGGSIDRWFAGMPRSSVWPADGHGPSPAPTTLFQGSPGDARREATAARAAALAAAVRRDRAAPEFAGGAAANATLALWDVDDRPDSASAESLLPLAEADLERGRVALTEEDVGEAAIRLGLALRLAPDLAPAILDLLDGQPARELALVRGDAHRLVGQELEAQRAFGEAGRSGPLPTPEGHRP